MRSLRFKIGDRVAWHLKIHGETILGTVVQVAPEVSDLSYMVAWDGGLGWPPESASEAELLSVVEASGQRKNVPKQKKKL